MTSVIFHAEAVGFFCVKGEIVMLLSIAMVLMLGMALGTLCKKCRLPSLIGMLAAGILLGPYALNLLDGSLLAVSGDIRRIALIIILTRAGLSLDVSGLRKLGRSALMMCFVPATFELAGMLLLGPRLLGLTLGESAVMGAVLAAVSPAVVVPRMVKLMEEGRGTAQGIPQLILAGASVDDVYVIVLFSTFTGMLQGEGVSVMRFVNIPLSIGLGLTLGLVSGWLLARFFARFRMQDTVKVLVLLSWSFVLAAVEDLLQTPVTYSGLIAVMFVGVALQKHSGELSKALSQRYNKLWVAAEVFLFVLVGASVNIGYLGHVGLKALLVIVCALLARMLGVLACLPGSGLNRKEKLFVMLAYLPKATVQAAIGGIPLSLGLACGDTVLTVAVLAIVVTAPLGAFAIDFTAPRLLRR